VAYAHGIMARGRLRQRLRIPLLGGPRRGLGAMPDELLTLSQHELRTPMAAIVAQVELLRMVWHRTDDGERLAMLDDIGIAAAQLSATLEELLDLSLSWAGNLRIERRPVELGAAVRGAVGDVSRRFPGGLPVEVRLEVPDGLALDADPQRLRQVIRCLVDNAVKFNHPGGSVTISAHPAAAGARRTILVSDTGIGILPELQERVFERFFQISRGATRSHGGLGLGLAVVRTLAEAHGATVTLTSTPGAGTTVRLDWPGAPSEEALAGAEEHIDLTASRQVAARSRPERAYRTGDSR
jgi:signal transduction histidine kinase